ncbi:hypothetical protein GPROT2_03070 [Gammaproteobacteria bacterium]|nr:hypothetical protein GPROT2_03070 [Gammaproteobacteria bacterium]
MNTSAIRSLTHLAGSTLGCLVATAALASPVVSTYMYIDGYTPGIFWTNFSNPGGSSSDETRVEGYGNPGEVDVTSRARAWVSTANGQYAMGARAELDARYVPASLMQPTGAFSNTAEVLAISQIQDELTFTAPGVAPGASISVSLVYQLSGMGYTCAPVGCIVLGRPGEIPASAVYGEMQSTIGPGWESATYRIDYPAPGSTFTHSFSIANGSSQAYTLLLRARVFSDTADGKALNMDIDPGYFQTQGDANYLSTLTITGIQAFDGQGAPLEGFTVTNSDGVALAVVPAPSGLWLFGPGLLALLQRSRRRRAA